MSVADQVMNSMQGAGEANVFALPMHAMNLASYVDNPWTVAANRAKKAGKELAHVLLDRAHGERPVTLFGWSLGARVVFACLEELAKEAKKAKEKQKLQGDASLTDLKHYGLVENVFLVGSPITANPERWKAVQPLVAGRLVNAYTKGDWILPLVHRGCTGGLKKIAGLQPVLCEGVENLNIGPINGGHLTYRCNMKKIMKALQIHSSVQFYDGTVLPINAIQK
jgi:pimeloyl-ACP methyl ester carboxylesterase